tara:strand:+ start:14651 stop:15550 length:900 start_codon:yes stop_codon:yes gene_type:complete
MNLNANPNVDIVHVISQPDRPSGRGNRLKSPEVIECAKELSLPFFQCTNLNKEADFLSALEAKKPDLFIVFAFAQFLGKRVLSLPRLGCFNIHTSLLPRHRGAAPIHYGIWCGDKLGGVSIQKMVKEMDAGDICISSPIDISAEDTTPTLYEKLKDLAPSCSNQLISDILSDCLTFSKQAESDITFAPTIKKEEGFLDPALHSAIEVERMVRAFQPWPGVQILFDGKRCKFLQVAISHHSVPCGQLKVINEELLLGCSSGTLQLLQFQIEGKKPTLAKNWINGIQGSLPTISIISGAKS